MGSWIGHFDEAVFFICLSLWWCYKIFMNCVAAGCTMDTYTPQVSYPTTIRGGQIPLEIVMKILFPFLGFLGEVWASDGADFLDAEGYFQNISNIHHMPIYGAFVLHGLIDLAECYHLPVIKGTNYMSAALAFAWYGFGFYFHATLDDEKEPLENMMHLLSVPLMFITCIACIIEMWQGQGHVWPQLVRTWSVLSLGTWYVQVSFVLYIPPSGKHNPAWDQNDMRNVMAVVGIFGTHVILNLLFMCLMFAIICVIMRYFGKGQRRWIEYKLLSEKSGMDEKEESLDLLGNGKVETDEQL